MKKRNMFAAVLTLAMIFCAMTPVYAESRVDTLLQKMSVKQKVEQMFMPDFRKWSTDHSIEQDKRPDFTKMNDEVREIIKTHNFGGVILFANNVKKTDQTLQLTKDLQAAALSGNGIPMLIAIDQEGGIVYRLGSGSALPGNMAVGATNDPKYAELTGEIIGRELNALGINTNFAPDIDTNSNPNNPVIGLRSFSDDPEMVAKMGNATIKGLNTGKVISTVKHFPGHGDTAVDSHTGLPQVSKDYETWLKEDAAPFIAAMNNGVDMVMTAHIVYDKLDDTKVTSSTSGEQVYLPATLSKKILTDICRTKLGYKGVIVTDALRMQGVAANFGKSDAVIRAIQAGVDIVLMPTEVYGTDQLIELDNIINDVVAKVQSGEIKEERINESVKRILSLKEKRGILDYNPDQYTLENALNTVGSATNRNAERAISEQAITLVQNKDNTLPLKPKAGQKVLNLVPYSNEIPGFKLGMRRLMSENVIDDSVQYEAYRFSNTTTEKQLENIIKGYDYVIVNSELGNVAQMQNTHWLKKNVNLAIKLAHENNAKVIVMSTSKPYDVQEYKDADGIVVVYGNKGMDPTEKLQPDTAFGPNLPAGIVVIFGGHKATGKLPVNVYKFDSEKGIYTKEIVFKRGFGLRYKEENTKPVLLSLKGEQHVLGTQDEVVVKTSSKLDNFLQLLVDNKEVANTNYTVTSGSTMVNVKADYLNTLSVGKHVLSVVSKDGNVNTNIEIVANSQTKNSNNSSNNSPTGHVTNTSIAHTSDQINFSLYGLLGILTLSAMAIIAKLSYGYCCKDQKS